ncbi:MAG: tRNA lysidine(34) synthetase TilS [Verrucomicrobiota bacterium]
MATSLKSLIHALQQHPSLAAGFLPGLGLSGGLDSMVLATALHQADIPFRALHFNHNWRGAQSRQDQQFVRNWCQHRKIPFTTRTWQRPARSEAAARQARHSFFHKTVEKYQLDAVLLAHHRNDLTETFLLQLLRGSGPEGLASLLPERTVNGLKLVRPLLQVTRADLEKIARDEKILWREDTSNTDESFARNKIRHRILPYLQKHSQRDPLPLLSRTADILAIENDYWQQLMPQHLPEKLPVKLLLSRHIAYQRRLIQTWLQQSTGARPTYEETESVRTLLTRTSPAKVNLKQGRFCRRRAGLLFIQ